MPIVVIQQIPHRRRLFVRLVVLLALAVAALLPALSHAASSRAQTGAPGWSRPILNIAHPPGDYLNEDDQWLAVHLETIVDAAEGGGLKLHHRAVYRSLQDEPVNFIRAFRFDDASERLSAPSIRYERKKGRWKTVNAARDSVEAPIIRNDFVTANRQLVLSAGPVAPGGHVVISWSVTDQGAYPGELSIFPVHATPVLKRVVRVADGADVRMLSVTPGVTTLPQLVTRLEFEQVPAESRLTAPLDWQASAFDHLPHAFVSRQTPATINWKTAGSRVRDLLDEALAISAGGEDYRTKARQLIAGLDGKRQQIAALSNFVQQLNYRNVEWGIGAYQPDSPAEVLRTRSGDCKAKTLLLHAMLREIGVASTPVLARLGDSYVNVQALRDGLLPAQVGVFNHMVLAIDAPTGVGEKARLRSGAGKGWLLFDPTDSLATFGLAPRGLHNTPAVWLTQDATLFRVELPVEIDTTRVDVEVSLDPVQPTESASFTSRISGASIYTQLAQDNQTDGEISARLKRAAQSMLRTLLPGAEVESVEFTAPDHLAESVVAVTLKGRVNEPLQPLTNDLYALPAPLALSRHSLAAQDGRWKLKAPDELTGPAAKYVLPLCCHGASTRLLASVTLRLPTGWELHRAPKIKTIDSPWVSASTRLDGQRWEFDIGYQHGNFTTSHAQGNNGAELAQARLKDMNRISKLWRGKFIVRKAGVAN